MQVYAQAYVRNSLEAAETYCKAFGAEITCSFVNPDGTAYEHCALSAGSEGSLALAEAQSPYDVREIHARRWETMTFIAFELGSEEAVHCAFDVLSDGGVVLMPIGALPWNPCNATVMDKYGVCWWIAIWPWRNKQREAADIASAPLCLLCFRRVVLQHGLAQVLVAAGG